jgi:putative endonuclease
LKLYYVYILASRSRVIYTGVTGDLETRLASHRSFANPKSFTAQYSVTRLVHVEEYSEVTEAIAREKEIKGWRRAKKIRLIEAGNLDWNDLAPQ